MGLSNQPTKAAFLKHLVYGLLATAMLSGTSLAWWNPEWMIRKKITLDTTATGAGITEPIGTTVVLIRLHAGNFQFTSAQSDGSDLRVIAADDKTLLKFHVEKFDPDGDQQGFLWVQIPDVKPGAQTTFWLYYGNEAESVANVEDSKETYDADTVLVYHLGEVGAAARDFSASGNNAEKAGIPVPGSIIGGGLRFTGQSRVTVPSSPSLEWKEGSAMTWSAWIKLTELASNAVIFSRQENASAFAIGVDDGVPYVEVTDANGARRSAGEKPIEANSWNHLAVVAEGSQITVYLNGAAYGKVDAALPALNGSALLGGGVVAESAAVGFIGELDELEISNVARSLGSIKLAADGQGVAKGEKVLTVGNDEAAEHGGGESELAKHVTLITDISKSLTFDGWVVIVLCAILAVVGWVITAMKFVYLNRIKKATGVFLKEWEKLSADFGSLDHGDEDHVNSMGGKVSTKAQKLMRQSPLYHIFRIGSSEIQHRVVNAKEGFKGLSERSMHAIRATLDGGLVREVQRLNSNLVFLTIGIAGGPYLGLLGTVIGVMITFAVIAKSGAVEVNSIAPGIAGALLATVAGLAVAIPALFAYSYISSRIKDAVSEMQIFIDEFVAKIAESFPSTHD